MSKRIRVEATGTVKLIRYITVTDKEAKEWQNMSQEDLACNMYPDDCDDIETEIDHTTVRIV